MSRIPAVRELILACKPESNERIIDRELFFLLSKLGVTHLKVTNHNCQQLRTIFATHS